MGHIRSYLASRAVVTGAAVVLLGSGAALADPGSFGLETATDAGGDNENARSDPALIEATEEPESDSDSESEPEGQDDDADERIEIEEVEASGDEERSPRAVEVHGSLTGEEDPSPGDPGFGAAVSANAKERGGNGRAVSEAARGNNNGRGHGRGAEDRERGGPPDGVPGLREDPPSNAGDPDRVGPPEHVPQHARDNANRGGDEDATAPEIDGDEPATSNE